MAKILTLASTSHTLFLSEGGFYTITFLVDKQLRRMSIYNPERLVQERKILLRILDTFQISSASRFGLKQGVEDENFRDLEDSYQYQAAINCGADILLTINVKDFVGVSDNKRIKIMTPQSFVDEFLIIRKTKCYRFIKRNVLKRKTKRLRYRCPPEPYSNSVRTDFFSYSNAIILESQQINTSI